MCLAKQYAWSLVAVTQPSKKDICSTPLRLVYTLLFSLWDRGMRRYNQWQPFGNSSDSHDRPQRHDKPLRITRTSHPNAQCPGKWLQESGLGRSGAKQFKQVDAGRWRGACFRDPCAAGLVVVVWCVQVVRGSHRPGIGEWSRRIQKHCQGCEVH